MKRLLVIMLILVAVGVASAYNNEMRINNHSTKTITVGVAIGGEIYGQVQELPPKSSTILLGCTGLNHKVKAVLGNDFNLTLPGFYEIKYIVLEHGQTNVVDFYFAHLYPVDPGNPGEGQ